MGFQVTQEYAYEIINGSAVVWRCFSRTTKAVIPSEIDGYPVTSVAPYAFSSHMDEKLMIGKKLTSLQGKVNNYKSVSQESHKVCIEVSKESEIMSDHQEDRLKDTSFNSFALDVLCGDQLEEVVLPNSVKRVGRYCFYDCKNLNKLSFTDALIDWGSGAFTGCHQIEKLEVNMYQSEKTTLKDLLVELPEPVEVDYRFISDTNGYYAKLIFPEYYEEGVENTPARLINLTIHGSGMRFRNCFEQRRFLFEEYDKHFRFAGFQEKFEVVASLAEGRLCYPYALKEEYKMVYEDYLIACCNAYGRFLLDRGDVKRMLWFIELVLSRLDDTVLIHKDVINDLIDDKLKKEDINSKYYDIKNTKQRCLHWLSQMIDYAARVQKQEMVSLLMDYNHCLKPKENKKKRSFDFDL